MNKKKLYIKLFWESPVLTLATLLLYTILISGILITFSKFRFTKYVAEMLSPFQDNVVVTVYDDNSRRENERLLSGLTWGEHIQNTGTYGAVTGNLGYYNGLKIVQYSEPISRQLKYPLSSGRWIEDSNEIVLTSDAAKRYSLDDTVTFTVYNEKGETTHYELTIVGFLAVDLLFFNEQTYTENDVITARDFVTYVEREGAMGLIHRQTQNYGIVEDTFAESELNVGAAVFLQPTEGVTSVELAEDLQEKWDDYGKVEAFEPYATEYELRSTQFWRQKEIYLLLLYMALILCLLVVWNCHVIIKKKKRYAVFYMSGASYKQIVRLLTMKFYLLVLIAFRLGIYAANYVLPCDRDSYLQLESYECVIALVLCFLFNLLVANITYRYIKRKNPFRERWEV